MSFQKALTFQTNYIVRKMYTSNILDFNNDPTIGRLRYLDVFLELYKKEPFLGYGAGDVENELLERLQVDRGYDTQFIEKQNVHNYYFHLLLVGGVPLLLLFFGATLLFHEGSDN